MGAVGVADTRIGYECLEGYARPIAASDCPVSVVSHYERRAFGTLRTTLRMLSETVPDAAFESEKPLFEMEAPDGPAFRTSSPPDSCPLKDAPRRGRDGSSVPVQNPEKETPW